MGESNFDNGIIEKVSSGDKTGTEPIADWVQQLSEGEAEYANFRTRKEMRDEYFEGRNEDIPVI